MKKMTKKVEDFFFNIYSLMEKSTLLVSIKQGFMMIIPVFMIGAFALLILNIPIPIVNNFIETALNGRIYTFFDFVHSATLKIASLYILIAVTYRYSLNYTKTASTTNIMVIMVSLGSYFAFLGIDQKAMIDGVETQVLFFSYLDVKNVFSALVTAYLATKLFFLYSKFRYKKKRKFDVLNTEVDFRVSISSIFPMFLTILTFVIFASLISVCFDVKNFNALIIKVFSYPFNYLGRRFFGAALLIFFQSFFWFFGVHGSNTLESLNQTIFADAQGELYTKTFFDVFVLMGGCGTALCLLIALLIFSKSRSNRNIVRHSALPMAFNINEIMVFGLPIVLNPILVLPFIGVPLVCLFNSYWAVKFGIMPIPCETVYWTTPVFLSGYQATNSIMGILVQFFNLSVGVLLYMPFIKMNDRIQKRKFYNVIDEMVNITQENEKEHRVSDFLDYTNYISKTGMEVANKLKDAIIDGEVEVFYQPLVKYSGRVVSSEALLKWKCDGENYLYPPLITSIAKESGVFDALTQYIIEKVLSEAKYVLAVYKKTGVSVNIEARQLADEEFISWILERVKEYQIPKGVFTLELTEESELNDNIDLKSIFLRLKEAGIKIAIDDFSMGYTSLKYLRDNMFDYVKLDGNITQGILTNPRVEGIVSNVVNLGASLNFYVVAEYVENKEQRNKLHKLGVDIYQGYYYSKAIKLDDYLTFIAETSGIKEPTKTDK